MPEQFSLYGAMLFIWYQMQKHRLPIELKYYPESSYEIILNYHTELQKFADTIQMLK